MHDEAGVDGDQPAGAGVPNGEVLLLGLGCTGAVALHAGLQWLGARRAGVRVRPTAGWRDPEVRDVLRRVGAGGGAGFEDQRFESAFDQVGRGGQAHGAGADHGNGKVLR